MTPSEINRAIAELCGWKWFDHPDVREKTKTFTLPDKWVTTPSGELVCPHSVPNYHASLDACREFLSTIQHVTEQQRFTMIVSDLRWKYQPLTHEIGWLFITATAPHLCEAFLRLHGKWGAP